MPGRQPCPRPCAPSPAHLPNRPCWYFPCVSVSGQSCVACYRRVQRSCPQRLTQFRASSRSVTALRMVSGSRWSAIRVQLALRGLLRMPRAIPWHRRARVAAASGSAAPPVRFGRGCGRRRSGLSTGPTTGLGVCALERLWHGLTTLSSAHRPVHTLYVGATIFCGADSQVGPWGPRAPFAGNHGGPAEYRGVGADFVLEVPPPVAVRLDLESFEAAVGDDGDVDAAAACSDAEFLDDRGRQRSLAGLRELRDQRYLVAGQDGPVVSFFRPRAGGATLAGSGLRSPYNGPSPLVRGIQQADYGAAHRVGVHPR